MPFDKIYKLLLLLDLDKLFQFIGIRPLKIVNINLIRIKQLWNASNILLFN